MKDPANAHGAVERVVIRYADGRTVTVIPDARRERFSADDAKELRKILDKASSDLEWADISSKPTM